MSIPRICAGQLPGLLRGLRYLDSACLAPSPGLDLSLDDRDAANSAGGPLRVLRRVHHAPEPDRDVVLLKQLLGLVLEKIHVPPPFFKIRLVARAAYALGT